MDTSVLLDEDRTGVIGRQRGRIDTVQSAKQPDPFARHRFLLGKCHGAPPPPSQGVRKLRIVCLRPIAALARSKR